MITVEEQVLDQVSTRTRAFMFKVDDQIKDQVSALILSPVFNHIWWRQGEQVCEQVKLQIYHQLRVETTVE